MILLVKQNVKLSQVRVSVVRVLCAAGMQLGGMCTGPLVGVGVGVGGCVCFSFKEYSWQRKGEAKFNNCCILHRKCS